MFEELDDPTPPLRDPEALARVRARGQALRRRRQLALGSGAGAATALVAVLLLALPGGGLPQERLVPASPSATTPAPVPTTTPPTGTAEPTPGRSQSAPADPDPEAQPDPGAQPDPTRPATTPRPSSPAPVAPSPVPSDGPAPTEPPGPSGPPATSAPAEAVLELRGGDLGVTAVGQPRAQAVAAVRAVLGAPVGDPATTVDCVEASEEVAWAQFRLAFDAAGRVSGWSSRSRELTTPSGVRAGTTVERLRQVYGDRLRLHPSDTEAGDTYTVEGVDMLGQLDGVEPGDRVVALRSGACTGP